MELSRKSWLYRIMNLYCDPADNICEFAPQLIPVLIIAFILIMGTVGFITSIVLDLYNNSLDALKGFDFFLAYSSFLSLIVIVSAIFAVVVMYLTYLYLKRRIRKQSSKVLNEAVKRLNPIKAKAEKFCIKIKYKD